MDAETAPASVVLHLAPSDAARTADEYFRAFRWEPALDPERVPAERYLAALFDGDV